MNQQRLDISFRKLSLSEAQHRQKIDRLSSEIKEQRQLIQDTKGRLQRSRERQQENGLRTAEIPVTDELIQAKLTPLKDYLKLLESKFESLTKQKPKIQKEAAQQTDMFNS